MVTQLQVFGKIMALLLLGVFVGCSGFKKVEREIATPESFQKLPENRLKLKQDSSPFLKIHMQNGNTYVLQDWQMDTMRQYVAGNGTLFNANRDILRQGQFQVGIDSVTIFETNRLKTSGTAIALTVFTGITAAVTVFCIANPKSCFGSCPTFYASDEDSMCLQAEGFSASIAPSLEATDIDALFRASATDNEFAIEMRNEALETHVVRSVDLLAVPKAKGSRVLVDRNGNFRESASILPPVSANASEGDCLPLLLNIDGNERYSRTDSTYLGAKEIIELEFDHIPNRLSGLIIGCRQTLLSTYLLYQTFAYMGTDAGYWIAQIQRQNIKLHQTSIAKILGGIEVLTQDSLGNWNVIDQIGEYGPLATDIHLVPLEGLTGKSAKIRLRMTKGNWRIDYAALAERLQPAQAIRMQPYIVLKEGLVDEHARARLSDSTQTLVTLPGDVYSLHYQIPTAHDDYELFLQSRGYYLEWIRKEWIEEENPFLLAELLLNPKAALTRLAPEFKQVEAEMETYFWRSRYAKP